MKAKPATAATPAPAPVPVVRQSGDIVIGAEAEPQCLDWISTCAGAAWGVYMVEANTMPRAYDYNENGYQPSALLAGAATLVTVPKQVVTYHINPLAVWDDGQPITSADFRYTWDQIAHGQNIYGRTGYDQISGVDDSDPRLAVVTFLTHFPDWRVLFGGLYGLYPSHLLEGKDRDAVMKDGYTFSGGPWKLDHWTKGNELELVANPRYWGKKANLSSVTFKFITDPVVEQQDFTSGQILAMYPAARSGVEALRGTPGTSFSAVSGLSYDALWFNVAKTPLDSKPVRQALAYATDREAIVRQLSGSLQPGISPIQTMFTPAFGAPYSSPFIQYTVNLSMVNSLMTGDGWAKASDGIWAKNGTRASLNLKTAAGMTRLELIAQAVQAQWQAAGFELTVTQEKPSVLFGQDLPGGNFQVGLYPQTPADNDSGQCFLWCSKNIPTQANGSTGQNWTRINDPNLDTSWADNEANLDDAARIADARRGSAVLAQDLPVLPLDPWPDIVVVNADKLATETGTFRHNFVFGPFTYLNYWFLK